MNLIQLMKYSWVSDELKNIYEAQGAYATNMYLNLLQLTGTLIYIPYNFRYSS